VSRFSKICRSISGYDRGDRSALYGIQGIMVGK
jgi:hypothetical protein